MGTFRVELDEMIDALEKALNDIQGDFTRKDLLKALEFMKKYPYVCDAKSYNLAEKKWEKLKKNIGFYGDKEK